MRTPERIEKDKIRHYLDSRAAYYFMPVQTGYGRRTVDILACIRGRFWAIEVKRDNSQIPVRQRQILEEIEQAGGMTTWGDAERVIRDIEKRLAMFPDLTEEEGGRIMKDRPQNTPLDEWPLAWLKIECASLLDTPGYILATDDEKRRDGLPATVNEMREFIRGRRIGDAILADPTLLD